jgi:integrase
LEDWAFLGSNPVRVEGTFSGEEERTRRRRRGVRGRPGPGLAGRVRLTAGDDAGGYVVTDELGLPVHPEWYSDEFARLLKRTGLRKIRLHDSRHTTLSLMEKAGVPISIVSKWAGHYDAAFTMKTYVHASDEDLKQGTETLARIHKIA